MNKSKVRPIAKLPIYCLAAPQLSEDKLDRLAARAFGMQSYSAEKGSDRLLLSTRGKRFEFNYKTGSVWMADQAQLWRPELKPRLPKAEEAETLAHKYLRKHGLLPKSDGGIELKVGRVSTGGTRMSTYDPSSERRQNRQLDIHMSYGLNVMVTNPETQSKTSVAIIGEKARLALQSATRGM